MPIFDRVKINIKWKNFAAFILSKELKIHIKLINMSIHRGHTKTISPLHEKSPYNSQISISTRSQILSPHEGRLKLNRAKRFTSLISLIEGTPTSQLGSAKNKEKTKIDKLLQNLLTTMNPPAEKISMKDFHKTDQAYMEGKTKIKNEVRRRQKLLTISKADSPLKFEELKKRDFGNVNMQVKNQESSIQGISPVSSFKLPNESRDLDLGEKASRSDLWSSNINRSQSLKTFTMNSKIGHKTMHAEQKESAAISNTFQERAIEHRIKMERLITKANKSKFLASAKHFQVISPSTLKMFGQEKPHSHYK
ncbi:unnamed protein product [Blepharisma stoltei]|uniref:Uncharacterized protein n=1 Tax=Blepharisma stoltei TaxID=1481888 RepID=A0AAU9IDK0_9CILI|nr:unnamed protein product [Blepharisma stoltei]